MPELPEVETVVQGLKPLVEGCKILRVHLNRPNLRFNFEPEFATHLEGLTIQNVTRRAKYLLFATSDPAITLLAHLGMTGNFRFAEPNQDGDFAKHDHVVFELEASRGPSPYLVYSDPRRFGFMHLTRDVETDKFLAHLGPEPLGNQFSAGAVALRAEKRAQPIKSFLLDQSNIAGLGNIYVCEALWRAKIAPDMPASKLVTARRQPTKKLEDLCGHIKDVLSEAIQSGGSTLQDYRNVEGTTGYFQHRFAAYDREKEPCLRPKCSGKIGRIVQAGRSTFYCQKCQGLYQGLSKVPDVHESG